MLDQVAGAQVVVNQSSSGNAGGGSLLVRFGR